MYKQIMEDSPIFVKNKEFQEYLELVSNPNSSGHKHHILPRAIFPEYTNSKWNIVRLSVENHRRAHGILTKIVSKEFPEIRNKALVAYGLMKDINMTSETYDEYCKAVRDRQLKNNSFKGKTHTDEYKQRLRERMSGERGTFYGKAHTPEICAAQAVRCRATFLGTKQSEEHVRKRIAPLIGKKRNPKSYDKHRELFTGVPISESHRLAISKGLKSAPKITCPHCGKVGIKNNMHRYHFDNCKFKTNVAFEQSDS